MSDTGQVTDPLRASSTPGCHLLRFHVKHPARQESGVRGAPGLWTYALVPRETSRCTPGVVACEHRGRGMPAVHVNIQLSRPPDLRDREVALVDPARSTRRGSPAMVRHRRGLQGLQGSRAPGLGASGLGRSGARARAIRGSGAPGLSRSRICDAERRASLQLHVKHQRVSGRPDLGRRPWITAVPREHPDELEASGSAGACHRTALTIPPEQSVGGSGRTRLRARPRSRAQGHVHLRRTRRIGGRVPPRPVGLLPLGQRAAGCRTSPAVPT